MIDSTQLAILERTTAKRSLEFQMVQSTGVKVYIYKTIYKQKFTDDAAEGSSGAARKRRRSKQRPTNLN